MKTLAFLLLALASPALAVTQWIDAAELDGEGNPLDGFVATRAFIDNRDGLTDLTDMRFALNWTGTATSLDGHGAWDNPENPWYGARNALPYQVVGGVGYSQGVVYYPPTHEWGPGWNVDPTPDDDTNSDDYILLDTVPAGLAWDNCFSVEGEDVHLFQSPATAETSFNGETYTLYDSDPMPQTIPEPACLAVLLAGACFLLRRKPA